MSEDTVPKNGTDGLEAFSVEKTLSGYPYMKSDPYGDYVTRSQAESEIRKVRKDAEELLAAKGARIKELEHVVKSSGKIYSAKMRQIEALGAKLAAAEKALKATHEAISEYYRYQTGGEMRGSYDGKPERNALWKSMYQARAVLGWKP